MNLAVLVSGSGTNLQAILDGVADGRIPETTVRVVVSDRPGVQALKASCKIGEPGRPRSPERITRLLSLTMSTEAEPRM